LGISSNKHDAVKYIKKAIKNKILSYIDDGLEWIIMSGQMGIELWAAEVVFELQIDYPHLQLAIFTPYEEQDKNW
ncbi:SLOG family protein, partial [Bacillus sp. JJ664]